MSGRQVHAHARGASREAIVAKDLNATASPGWKAVSQRVVLRIRLSDAVARRSDGLGPESAQIGRGGVAPAAVRRRAERGVLQGPGWRAPCAGSRRCRAAIARCRSSSGGAAASHGTGAMPARLARQGMLRIPRNGAGQLLPRGTRWRPRARARAHEGGKRRQRDVIDGHGLCVFLSHLLLGKKVLLARPIAASRCQSICFVCILVGCCAEDVPEASHRPLLALWGVVLLGKVLRFLCCARIEFGLWGQVYFE